jgi:hypothetical protein
VTPEPVRQPQASGVLVTAGARKLCRAVGTTAWAVLADIALDAESDPEGRLVAATNVRRIAITSASARTPRRGRLPA